LKKVCIVRHGYYPSDPRVQKEAEALIDRGYKVNVICLRNKGEQSWDNACGVNIFSFKLFG